MEKFSQSILDLMIPASQQERDAAEQNVRRIEATLVLLSKQGFPTQSPTSFEDICATPADQFLAPLQPRRDLTGDRKAAEKIELRMVQQRTNAFIEIFSGQAPTDVGKKNNSPLSNLSFAHKDVFVSNNRFPTEGASGGHKWIGPRSECLTKLEAAGSRAVGATNLDAFCYTALGLNRDFGRVLNPHDRRFAIGGSSSGSAAAVAAGAVDFALSTDTGGSTRIPASLCGTYGLKPTYGAIYDLGVAPLSKSHDTVGVLSKDFAVIRDVFAVISSRDFPPQKSDYQNRQGPPSIRIGINTADLNCGLDADVEYAFSAFVQRCARFGEVAEVPFPSVDNLNTVASVITAYEAVRTHQHAIAENPQHFPQAVLNRLLVGQFMPDETYQLAISLRAPFLLHILDTVFADVDFLICPTIRCAAPQIDQIEDTNAAEIGRISLEFLRQNRPFSYLGLPSLSVPIGHDINGIPIGAQIIGKPNAESDLLSFAQMLFTI